MHFSKYSLAVGCALIAAPLSAQKVKVPAFLDEMGPRAAAEKDKQDGFLDAFQFMLGRHLTPDGTVDSEALGKAIEHAEAMPPANETTGMMSPDTVTWKELGPHNYGIEQTLYNGIPPNSGCINAIAYAPSLTTTYYAGAQQGGLWKSTDSGLTWKPLSDNWPHMAVNSVAVDPTNPDVVYVGTGQGWGYFGYSYSLGMMKSTDGGLTFKSYGVSQFGKDAPVSIVIDPANTQIITIGVVGPDQTQTGIWRSANGGLTWVKKKAGNIDAVKIGPADKSTGVRTYWAAGAGAYEFQDGPQMIYKSVDQGVSWAQIAAPSTSVERTLGIAVSKLSTTTLYVLTPEEQAIWKSVDGGKNWTNTTNNFPADVGNGISNWYQFSYDFYIETTVVHPTGLPAKDGVFVGLAGADFSPDGGASWEDIGKTFDAQNAIIHTDQHAIMVNPKNGTEALLANDGGVYRFTYTPNTGTWTFANLNKTFNVCQFYHIALHPTNPNFVMGGLQDTGTAASRNDFSNWTQLSAGDGGFVAYDIGHGFEYSDYEYLGNVIQTVFNTQYRNFIGTNFPGYRMFVAPLVYGEFSGKLYAASNVMNTYDDQFETWSFGSQLLTNPSHSNDAITTPEVNKGNGNRMYAGTYFGTLWMSDDAGVTWTEIDGGSSALPQYYFTSISSSPLNPNDVLVTFAGSGHKHTFRCLDVSKSSATRQWQAVDGSGTTGLADISTNAIVRDPALPATKWYLASDVGVFVTTNAGSSWANMGST